jgi:phosphomannomutase/phosphoglucomutase
MYDIRGVYGTEISEDLTYAIAWSFGSLCIERTGVASPLVSVGMDARLHSPSLKSAFILGLQKAGCRVVDIGLCPTPLTYYSAFRLKPEAFAMITASHNPPEDNGFKLGIGKDTLHSDDIAKVGERALSAPSYNKAQIPDDVEKIDIIALYQDEIVENFKELPTILEKVGRPLKVVIDSGNGTAGPVLPDIMRRLDLDVTEMFSEPDGNFPNHHPDPTLPEALDAIRKVVFEKEADLGVALDGDADRIGVMDEAGNVVWGDMLLLILARNIIEEAQDREGDDPPPLVISEVKASQVLYDEVRKAGGRALMWKTGHSLIKAKMKETGAAIAGEMSGHIFLADRYYGYDDALYAALRLIEVYAKALAEEKVGAFSSLLDGIPSMANTPEIRFPSTDDRKFSLVEKVADALRDHKESGNAPRIREIVDIDGVRAVFEKGWGLIRASNTQPVLVMRFEGETDVLLESYRKAFYDILTSLENVKDV